MSATNDPAGYYRALGVPRSATADEIRAAFRSRAMSAHPDRAGATTADSEAFRLIREAYEVLRDPRQRMAYDAVAAEKQRAAETAEPASRPSAEASAASAGPESAGRPRRGIDRALDAVPARLARYALPAALGLTLLLLVALGALWSANRQLADRKLLIDDLYGRLALLSETQAELNAQYRSLAFLDLERALRLGRSSTGAVRADAGPAAYVHHIRFAPGGSELTPGAEDGLARALIEVARRIERLPADADWLIVLDAQARRATLADQVAVEAWEPALLQLATVLDHLLVQGLPSERLAIRFAAGFASTAPAETPPAGSMVDAAPGQVSIKLLCCAP